VFKEAENETKEVQGKNKPIMTRGEAKKLRPCMGVKFAELAILDLERIEKNDEQRAEGFALVKGWITQNEI